MAGTSKNRNYVQYETTHAEYLDKDFETARSRLFMLILISATLFGFSYYAFGFPIVTIAESSSGSLSAILSSAIIGISYGLHFTYLLYLLGAAGLGFATGAIETFEPVVISKLGSSSTLSGRMGWLSSSRAIGLFVSNAAMGFIFQFSQFGSYMYAALTSCAASAILVYAEVKSPRELKYRL